MSGFPVTVVPSGGLPVTSVSEGAAPAVSVSDGGYPVTLVSSGGVPLVIEGLNLVSNGDFANTDDWVINNAEANISGGALNFVALTANRTVYQEINITSGQSYVVQFDVVSQSAGNVTPILGGTSGTFRNSPGTYTQTLVAGGSNTRIAFVGSNGATISIDNVSVVPA